jgi:RNA polymerase sigma-70 factor (ECF subfamily)
LNVAYHDYEKGLNARAFFKVSNHAIGEDLVQDTFIKTWKYLAKGGKIETMKAFLYHVLNNLIIDQYRKHKTTSLDIILEKGFEPVDEKDDFKHLYDILDGKKALLLIARLPKKYQKVMRMRYMEDLTLKEMSLATGQSRNVIAVQAHRGLEILKSLYI